MEVLTEEKASAEVKEEDLGLPCDLPPLLTFERPPVVCLESCGRYLQRFPDSSFIRFLRFSFISLLGLCVIRLIIELEVSFSVICWAVAVVTVAFVGKKYAHLVRQCLVTTFAELSEPV